MYIVGRDGARFRRIQDSNFIGPKSVKDKFGGGGLSLKSLIHAVLYVQNERLNNGGESTIDALERRRSIGYHIHRRTVHWKLNL